MNDCQREKKKIKESLNNETSVRKEKEQEKKGANPSNGKIIAIIRGLSPITIAIQTPKVNSVPQVHPTPNQIHRKSAATKREKSIYTKFCSLTYANYCNCEHH
jgi:hypothetical protein